MDPSRNPIPSIPANQKDLKLYFLKLEIEVDSINGSQLIEDKDQLDKPTWKGKHNQGKKYKQYKKKSRFGKTSIALSCITSMELHSSMDIL